MTQEEKILWEKLRNSQLKNMKFRRQYSVGFYILDFYCPEIKLCIELDGKHHEENDAKEYDKNRDEFLKSLGIKTVRFSNLEIKMNIENVVQAIISAIKGIKT